MSAVEVKIIGKVVITAEIRALTGLRIGGSSEGLKIGGVDARVIRDPRDRPYIPGSAIKGKLRNLLERKLNVPIKKGKTQVNEHRCQELEQYKKCPVCKIFGLTPETPFEETILTRLIVRDTSLDENSVRKLPAVEPTLTEIKTEIMIDRRTGTTGGKGAGGLRQIERVPADAVFKPAEFIFNIYEEADKELLKYLFQAMALLEHDYLGGMGSRGYGQVKLENIKIWWNKVENYENGNLDLNENRQINNNWNTPQLLIQHFSELKNKLT